MPGHVKGASGRIRTCDTWYRKPVLYPLSYGGLRADDQQRRGAAHYPAALVRTKPEGADRLGG